MVSPLPKSPPSEHRCAGDSLRTAALGGPPEQTVTLKVMMMAGMRGVGEGSQETGRDACCASLSGSAQRAVGAHHLELGGEANGRDHLTSRQ